VSWFVSRAWADNFPGKCAQSRASFGRDSREEHARSFVCLAVSSGVRVASLHRGGCGGPDQGHVSSW